MKYLKVNVYRQQETFIYIEVPDEFIDHTLTEKQVSEALDDSLVSDDEWLTDTKLDFHVESEVPYEEARHYSIASLT